MLRMAAMPTFPVATPRVFADLAIEWFQFQLRRFKKVGSKARGPCL